MNRIPIRVRLTLVFALVMSCVLLGVGWFVEARVGGDLSRALDQDLRARAQDLGALVKHGGSLQASRGTLVEPGESFAQLIDRHGALLDSTPTVNGRSLLRADELRRTENAPFFVDRPSVPGLDEPARMLVVPVAFGRRPLTLVVGATRENRAETLRSLRAAFLIGGPLILLLASLTAYSLAGAALRPVKAMSRRARDISTNSLNERLPVPPTRDEVGELGLTLNGMLGRLEDGLVREQRFVADAAHELRTPLALIVTEVELALRRKHTAEELRHSLRVVAEEADRLRLVADDLLLLARSEQGQLPLRLEPTDLADVLARVAARFASRARAQGRIVEDAVDETPVAPVDGPRIEQALGNLVDNALRHGAGRVRLSARTTPEAVELHVRDEGPGFPDRLADRAFERFSRGDEARTGAGAGLGLAIVAAIARAHGGSVAAANGPDGGADVWLMLPCGVSS